MIVGVANFLCPSDPTASPAGYGRVSYRFNLGPTHLWSPSNSNPASWDGPFTVHNCHRSSDFRDGLSQAAGLSERRQGDWTKEIFRRDGDYVVLEALVPDYLSYEDAIKLGRGESSGRSESRGGESWFLSGFHFTCYNHVMPPGLQVSDFAFRRGTETLNDRVNQDGVFRALSAHPGVVNVLMMDGAVKPVSTSIHIQTWRSMATRSSGDIY